MATYALFFVIGFVTEFSGLAEFYLLRELGLSVADCYAAATVVNLPWSFRPLFGLISDWAEHRHHQLAVISFMAFVLWMITRTVHNAHAAVFLLFLCEFTPSAGLTIADAYVCRISKRDDAAMPKHHRFRIMGRLLGSFLSGNILHKWGTSHEVIAYIFLIHAMVYMFSAPFAALFLEEDTDVYQVVAQKDLPEEEETNKEDGPKQSWAENIREVLRIAWTTPSIRFLLIFFTVFAALPDSGTSIQYFLVGPIHISPLTLATIELVRGAFDFLGTFVNFDVRADKAMTTYISMGNLLCIPIMAVVCRTVTNWMSDEMILITSSAISAWAASAFATLFTIQVAKLSPPGKEGGFYNTLISIPNVGQMVGVSATYAMTRYYRINHDDFSNLPQFVFTTSVLGCVASFCISLAQSMYGGDKT